MHDPPAFIRAISNLHCKTITNCLRVRVLGLGLVFSTVKVIAGRRCLMSTPSEYGQGSQAGD